ncbi:MAG: hypothetical protein VB032_01980 [Burkholderiaceae bacterium]|nr:hypothetical protein [Burkholderiaceae bacterium]
MKTLKDSFLENAHILIIALTLIVACAGWGGKLAQSDINNSLASYGYVPQYVAESGSDVVEAIAYHDEVNSTMVREESGYVAKGTLFATDLEQRAQALRDVAGAIL